MSENQRRPHGPHGHGPGGMMPGEKAKNFSGTIKKLFRYMGAYRYGLMAVAVLRWAVPYFILSGRKF